MATLTLKRICPFMDMTIYVPYEGDIEGENIGSLMYSPLLHIFSPDSKKILEELGYNIDELKINVIEIEYKNRK